MARPKVLLTGGSGFIGKNILESSLGDKYEWLSPSHRELDLADTDAVDAFFKKHKVQMVVHSAVKPGHRNAPDSSGLFYANTRMFFNLARHAEELERILVLGSGAIYGMQHYEPRMPEDFFGTHVPVDEHGFTKYVCEKAIERSRNIVDLRVFSIFGKYEDYAIRFISNMMCKCLFGLPLTMKQDRRFDFLFVDDLMPVLDHFLSNPASSSAYNVTPDETVSLASLAKKILKLSGKDLPIVVKEAGQALEYSGDNSRLKREFAAFKPTSFDQSLPSLYEWYAGRLSQINKEALLHDK